MNWSSCTESLPSSDMYPAGRATQFSGESTVFHANCKAVIKRLPIPHIPCLQNFPDFPAAIKNEAPNHGKQCAVVPP